MTIWTTFLEGDPCFRICPKFSIAMWTNSVMNVGHVNKREFEVYKGFGIK